MKEEQLHSIDVEIADRFYPVFVNNEEEATVVNLAKQVNREIAEMHRRYVNKLSKQDIMAMLLLTYAKKLHDAEQASNLDELTEQVDFLYMLLDEQS